MTVYILQPGTGYGRLKSKIEVRTRGAARRTGTRNQNNINAGFVNRNLKRYTVTGRIEVIQSEGLISVTRVIAVIVRTTAAYHPVHRDRINE